MASVQGDSMRASAAAGRQRAAKLRADADQCRQIASDVASHPTHELHTHISENVWLAPNADIARAEFQQVQKGLMTAAEELNAHSLKLIQEAEQAEREALAAEQAAAAADAVEEARLAAEAAARQAAADAETARVAAEAAAAAAAVVGIVPGATPAGTPPEFHDPVTPGFY